MLTKKGRSRNLPVILIAAILLSAALIVFFLPAASLSRRPPVVILLLDTLRADHLGSYGYQFNTSPSLDRFAAENVKFNFAVSAAPWTPPSVASILTGMYPLSHGLMPPNAREDAKRSQSRVDERLSLLSEILKENGYKTWAYSPNPWISEHFGFTQGFDTFEYNVRAPAGKINEAVFDAVKELKSSGNPFFMYIHYLDPHAPYEPPPEHVGLFPGKRSGFDYGEKMLDRLTRYDGEIHYLDTELGKLIQFFKEEGIYEDMVIVIVGDHGEQFLEHGFKEHGNVVYNVETHVPLLLRLGKETPVGKTVDHTVSTIDIFATILEHLGIEKPHQGALSVPLLDEEKQQSRDGVLSEILRKLSQRGFVSRDGYKLVVGGSKRKEMPELENPYENLVGVFNSRKDSLEQAPLSDFSDLERLRKGYLALSEAASRLRLDAIEGSHEVPEETLEQLKSLGYLD